MAKGITIDIRGLKDLQKRVGGIAPAILDNVDKAMHLAAGDFVNRAVNDAPVDEGVLRNGISFKRVAQLEYEVVSAAFYSPYIEWGTKSKAEVPSDLQAYANQFRGKGKAGNSFFESILAWVHRTGITARYSIKTRQKMNSTKADKEREYQAAMAIYYSILKKGIKPQPFFFQQRAPVYKALQAELPKAVKKAMKG
jgi:hypothetical protein